MVESTDSELVARCRRGDEAAWRALVERHAPLIHSICRAIVHDPDAADDAFLECFARLVQHMPSLEDPTRVRSWLVTTARRLGIDARRRAARQPSTASDTLDPIDESDGIDDRLERLQQRARVHSAMAGLDDRCRALLERLYLGESASAYETIAQQMSMAIGSIGPTRARCLEKLRRLYDALDDEMREESPR